MDKKFLLRLLVPTVLVVVAVLCFLMVLPATASYFAWFSWAWAVCMLAAALGLRYILAGVFASGNVVLRRTSILFGALFCVVAVFSLVWAIEFPHDWVVPLVAIIITAALFVSVLVTGGRKWDAGDNQKVGYKTYRERVAEQQKAEHKAD